MENLYSDPQGHQRALILLERTLDFWVCNLLLLGLVRGLHGTYFCKYAIFRERTGFAIDAVGNDILPKYARTTQKA